MRLSTMSTKICNIIQKAIFLINILLLYSKLKSLKARVDIACSFNHLISDCKCYGISKEVNGSNFCFDPKKCKDIKELECGPGMMLAISEGKACLNCKYEPCKALQIINGCECNLENIVEIEDRASYCNIGIDKCDSNINKEYCLSQNKEIIYNQKRKQNFIEECPKCGNNLCKNMDIINNCICKETIVKNDFNSQNYCIDSKICTELHLDMNGKCSDGNNPIFDGNNSSSNICPLCQNMNSCSEYLTVKTTKYCVENCSKDQINKIRDMKKHCLDGFIINSQCVFYCHKNKRKISKLIVILLVSIIPILVLIVLIVLFTKILKKKNQTRAHEENQNLPRHEGLQETNSVVNDHQYDSLSRNEEGYYMYSESRNLQ